MSVLRERGQASFEMILVTAVIFILIIIILNNYVEVQDSTVAVSILKARTLEKLGAEDGFYYIEKIDSLEDEGGISLTIAIRPAPPPLDFAEIENEIAANTKYETATVIMG